MPVWKPRPTHHEEKESTVRERGTPRGDDDILLHVTCILLIMTFPIVQMVSCRGPPQNTGPQAIACLACPIATPLGVCYGQRTQVHFIDGILNAQIYLDEILRPVVVPFIHDYHLICSMIMHGCYKDLYTIPGS